MTFGSNSTRVIFEDLANLSDPEFIQEIRSNIAVFELAILLPQSKIQKSTQQQKPLKMQMLTQNVDKKEPEKQLGDMEAEGNQHGMFSTYVRNIRIHMSYVEIVHVECAFGTSCVRTKLALSTCAFRKCQIGGNRALQRRREKRRCQTMPIIPFISCDRRDIDRHDDADVAGQG